MAAKKKKGVDPEEAAMRGNTSEMSALAIQCELLPSD